MMILIKKTFRQFRLNENNEWVEGAATPSPIFGIETLNNRDCDENVHIFEGERCVTAAHQCSLIGLTSMMGANSANGADWAILAKYRHFKQFVLIPDNDNPGKQYMHTVYKEIKRVCPSAVIKICSLPYIDLGDDFIDWLLRQDSDLKNWDGFNLMEKGLAQKLGTAFQEYVKEHCVDAEKHVKDCMEARFTSNPEPILDTLSEVLSCPIDAFPQTIQFWLSAIANQMQVPLDFLAVPFLVYSGSILGRKVTRLAFLKATLFLYLTCIFRHFYSQVI